MPAKILIADASPHAQRMGVRFLTELGYEVEGVSNGPAALKSIEERPPALIIAALSMPGISGFELCEQVKRRPAWAQIPILLALGPFEAYDAEEGKKVGAQGLIEKPFEPSKLEKVVGDFVPRPVPEPVQGAAAAGTADAGPALSAPDSAPVSEPVSEPVLEPAAALAAAGPAPVIAPEADGGLATDASAWAKVAPAASESQFEMTPIAHDEAEDAPPAPPTLSPGSTASHPGWNMEEIPLSEAEREAIWDRAGESAPPWAGETRPRQADPAPPPAPPADRPWMPEAADAQPSSQAFPAASLAWAAPETVAELASGLDSEPVAETGDALVRDALRAFEPDPAPVVTAAPAVDATMAVVRKVLASYLSPLMVEEVAEEILRQLSHWGPSRGVPAAGGGWK